MYKLKVCGMKHLKNIEALVKSKPDFIGFIFYEKSKRFVGDELDISKLNTPKSIRKVGVFVNSSIEYILENFKKNKLDLVQLHGNESPEFCNKLYKKDIKISKAFQIDEDFDFSALEAYHGVCDYFLFDTKTKLYGGSGKKFNWQVLERYDNKKPFFLSGGIDLEDTGAIKSLKKLNIYAIDINSKFEIGPGLKDIEKIKQFKEALK